LGRLLGLRCAACSKEHECGKDGDGFHRVWIIAVMNRDSRPVGQDPACRYYERCLIE
jgi:hypothetical protein